MDCAVLLRVLLAMQSQSVAAGALRVLLLAMQAVLLEAAARVLLRVLAAMLLLVAAGAGAFVLRLLAPFCVPCVCVAGTD